MYVAYWWLPMYVAYWWLRCTSHTDDCERAVIWNYVRPVALDEIICADDHFHSRILISHTVTFLQLLTSLHAFVRRAHTLSLLKLRRLLCWRYLMRLCSRWKISSRYPCFDDMRAYIIRVADIWYRCERCRLCAHLQTCEQYKIYYVWYCTHLSSRIVSGRVQNTIC